MEKKSESKHALKQILSATGTKNWILEAAFCELFADSFTDLIYLHTSSYSLSFTFTLIMLQIPANNMKQKEGEKEMYEEMCNKRFKCVLQNGIPVREEYFVKNYFWNGYR